MFKSLKTHLTCPECRAGNPNALQICEKCGCNLQYEFIEETPLGSSQQYIKDHCDHAWETIQQLGGAEFNLCRKCGQTHHFPPNPPPIELPTEIENTQGILTLKNRLGNPIKDDFMVIPKIPDSIIDKDFPSDIHHYSNSKKPKNPFGEPKLKLAYDLN
jgi:hypothetical protein